MADPTHNSLHGDLRGLARHGALIEVLGDPADDPERALLVMLARLLGDAETDTLISMVLRTQAD
jgi:hypothetical protein